MSAQAFVLQMVRAHYRNDDAAFAYAANTIGRQCKSPNIRDEILDITRKGFRSPGSPRPPRPPGGPSMDRLPKSIHPALQPLPAVGFPDLLLDHELQRQLDEVVEELEYRKHLAKRGLSARSRLLFHGPPGNGKTSVSAALANALGVDAYCASIPQIVGSYIGQTGQNLAGIFEAIRDGMVVVFDEIDAIGTSRSGHESAASKEMNSVVNSLLMLMDRHKAGVIVATTNRPEILDQALTRRFDEQFLFPPPSEEQMRALAERLCLKFEIGEVFVDHCQNFDEVTKTVTREARRIVMAELRAADADEDETTNETDN